MGTMTDPQAVRAEIAEQDREYRARTLAASLGLTITATRKGDRCPPWADGSARGKLGVAHCGGCGSAHGPRYRVTLGLTGKAMDLPGRNHARSMSLSFDYWPAHTNARPGYSTILAYLRGLDAPEAGVTAHALGARVRRFFTEGEWRQIETVKT